MTAPPFGPGCFVAIVGPSGAGKDTLIRGARLHLAHDARFVFPRRVITRPPGDENEDHQPLSVAAFLDAQAAGAFCLSWEAHGLHYGIPVSVCHDICEGKTVIANLSRAALFNMRSIFACTRVMSIQVSANVVRDRLLQRGRETVGEIEARLDRMQRYSVEGEDVFSIDNSGPAEMGVTALVDQLITAS